MKESYTEGKIFDRTNFTGKDGKLANEYENCTFLNCDLSSADLSEIVFSDCEFTGCNLAMAKLTRTSFRDVRFRECKLLGLRFDHCSEFLFAVDFENCILNLASFYGLKIKNTQFRNCSLQESDFTTADLTGAKFDNCDLRGAQFENCILEKSDFRTAFNYSFDPELNRIKGAKFSREGIAGLLSKYDITIE